MKCELEAAVSKIFNTLINIVHSHSYTTFTFEFENLHSFFFSFIILEYDFKSSRPVDNEISCLVLISESVSSDNNWLFPSWNESGDIFNNDGFSKDGTVQDVSDGSVGAFPHLFEIELLDSGFVRGDGGTFDTNFALFDGVGGIDGDLIVGGVSMFDAEVEVLNIEVEEGEDEFVLDGLPDDPGHLIAVELSNWVFNFNFLKLHQNIKRYFINGENTSIML